MMHIDRLQIVQGITLKDRMKIAKDIDMFCGHIRKSRILQGSPHKNSPQKNIGRKFLFQVLIQINRESSCKSNKVFRLRIG